MLDDNAAQRLLDALARALDAPADTSAFDGWREVFVVSEDEPLHVLRRGLRLREMAAEVRTVVTSHPDEDPDLKLRHFDQVEAVLDRFPAMVAVEMSMGQFVDGLGRDGLYSLELCESVLRRRNPGQGPDLARLSEIREKVLDLWRDIMHDDELDEELRDFLSLHLDAISTALSEVSNCGMEPVRDGIESLAGTFVTRRTLWQRLSDQRVVAVVTLLTALDAVLGIANAALGERDEPNVIVNVYEGATGCRVPQLPPGPRIVPALQSADEVYEAEIVDEPS